MSLSSYSSEYSSACRLEQFKTQHELARNFYDDVEFCPLLSFDEVAAHRSRIQQRSPYSSPRSSPPVTYNTATSSPPKRRAIPIINPENMTPVAVLQQQQQQQQQRYPQDYFQMAHWKSHHERPVSSPSSTASSLSSSASSFSPSMINSHVIPIINPSTGQPLLHQPMYDLTVR